MSAIIPIQNVLAPEIEEENAYGAKFLAFDIETADAPKAAIELAKANWKPPGNMNDPDKMEAKDGEDTKKFNARVKEARKKLDAKKKSDFAKIEKKSALLDGAPIATFAVRTESEEAVFYQTKYAKRPFKKIKGRDCSVFGYKNEKDLILGVRIWLDKRAIASTVIVGHNLMHFDLPKMRCAYMRHRLGLPKLFHPDARDVGVTIFDTMRRFRYFSTEYSDAIFVKLEIVLAYLGLNGHKGKMKGEEVPLALKAGKAREVAAYCLLDAIGTYEAFLILSGKTQDEVAT